MGGLGGRTRHERPAKPAIAFLGIGKMGALMSSRLLAAGHSLTVASSLCLKLPLSSKVAELFEATVEAGFGNYDHGALLLEIERLNPGVRVGNKPGQTPSPEVGRDAH